MFTMFRRKSFTEPTLAQVDADLDAALEAKNEPASAAATLSKAAKVGHASAAQHARKIPFTKAGPGQAPVPTDIPLPPHSSRQRANGFFVWYPNNAFSASVCISLIYIFKRVLFHDPRMIDISILIIGSTIWIVWGFFRCLATILRAEAVVEAETAVLLLPFYNPYIIISPFAIGVLKLLSTALALYLALLILLNIEILLLFPLVLKQRGYSYLYKELGTPVVGPVFMTQTRESVFWAMDGMFAPWSVAMGALGVAAR